MAAGLLSCGGPSEAPRVTLPVVVDPAGLAAVTTDLGYEVTLTEARVMIQDLAFTIAGEAHAAAGWRLSELWLPTAYAHPGHYQGGEVTGELRGRHRLRWRPGAAPQLGRATLLVGAYKSAQFSFTRAQAADGLPGDDPLLGHTAVLRGRARKGAQAVVFTVRVDAPEGRPLVGVPFELQVTTSSPAALGLRLELKDPLEGDTLFDGLDFAALDADHDAQLQLSPGEGDPATVAAYQQLRRRLQTHDHFQVTARAAP